MGFFSKVWKGVKKGFKAVFKPIKAVFKKVGKFMNKIGIVGQIALMFIPIPGLGALMSQLGSMTSGLLGGASTALGASAASGNILAQGAKFMLDGALKVGTKVGQGFKTITEGVKSFVTNSGKYLANKIPGVTIKGAPTSFFGKGSESVLGRASAIQSENFNAFMGKTPPVKTVPIPTEKVGSSIVEEPEVIPNNRGDGTSSVSGGKTIKDTSGQSLPSDSPTGDPGIGERVKGYFADQKQEFTEYLTPGADGVGAVGNTFGTLKDNVVSKGFNTAANSLLGLNPKPMKQPVGNKQQPYINNIMSPMAPLSPVDPTTLFGFEDMANYVVAPMQFDKTGGPASVWANFAAQRTA